MLQRLGDLIVDWRGTAIVEKLTNELARELFAGNAPFVGKALPDSLVGARLPPEIASAWIFVLRPRTKNPPHYHPNSTQHTAVVSGGGTWFLDGESRALAAFDRTRLDETLLVIAPNRAHAFEPGDEPLVVLSFHTVPPDQLIEIEVESGHQRKY